MEGKKVVVARILIDSIIDRQGLLRTGDVILQANGKTIKDPEQLQLAIEESGEFVVFKIQPSDINQKEIDSALPKAGKVAKVFVPKNRVLPQCESKLTFFFRCSFLYVPCLITILPRIICYLVRTSD